MVGPCCGEAVGLLRVHRLSIGGQCQGHSAALRLCFWQSGIGRRDCTSAVQQQQLTADRSDVLVQAHQRMPMHGPAQAQTQCQQRARTAQVRPSAPSGCSSLAPRRRLSSHRIAQHNRIAQHRSNQPSDAPNHSHEREQGLQQLLQPCSTTLPSTQRTLPGTAAGQACAGPHLNPVQCLSQRRSSWLPGQEPARRTGCTGNTMVSAGAAGDACCCVRCHYYWCESARGDQPPSLPTRASHARCMRACPPARERMLATRQRQCTGSTARRKNVQAKLRARLLLAE